MKRCHFCKGLIWPWQHYGRRRPLGKLFPQLHWHTRCWQAFDRMLQEEADAYERQTGI